MEVFGFMSSHSTAPDINPAPIIYDICTNARYGLGMPASQIGDQTLYTLYCNALGLKMSPCLHDQEQATSIFQRWAELSNTWIFWSENLLKFVPLGDSPISANGFDFVPVTTVQYDLTADDFQPEKDSPPITITRSDPSDAYNWVRLNISDRGNQYSTAVMEFKDQTSIMKYGLFQAHDVQADEICDRAIGALIAGLIGQRALYVRNTYEFNLGYNFCLLEPGDIVTVTDTAIGLSHYPVRIRTIEEDNKGTLKVTAEECPAGIGSAAVIGSQASSAVTLPGIDDDPGPVNPPALVEPPEAVTGGTAELWIGLSGASTNWGGAYAYISIDDVTYVAAGTTPGTTPQGVLIAGLASHADPDTVDTLSVDFTESQQTIASTVTDADADAGRTIILVENELIGFGAVTPNAHNSFSYNFTYLRRGFYNTAIAAHAAGAAAAVLMPSAMIQIALPAAYVGQRIYLKFTSFNILGGAMEDISEVTRYEYVPTGVAYSIDAPSAAVLAVTTQPGATSISLGLSWTASPGPALGSYEVQISSDGGTTWTAADVTLGPAAVSYSFNPAIAATTYRGRVRAFSANGLATSGWATSNPLNSGAAPPSSGTSLLPLVNGDTPVGIITGASGVPVYVVIAT
jgi:hypothetical protein